MEIETPHSDSAGMGGDGASGLFVVFHWEFCLCPLPLSWSLLARKAKLLRGLFNLFSWLSQVAYKSGIYKANRKPRDLTVLSFLVS